MCRRAEWFNTIGGDPRGDGGELSNAGVVPDGVGQSQHVAAAHLRVGLVAGGEVQQLEGVAHPLGLGGEHRTADHAHDAVLQHDPVRLLQKRETRRSVFTPTFAHRRPLSS